MREAPVGSGKTSINTRACIWLCGTVGRIASTCKYIAGVRSHLVRHHILISDQFFTFFSPRRERKHGKPASSPTSGFGRFNASELQKHVSNASPLRAGYCPTSSTLVSPIIRTRHPFSFASSATHQTSFSDSYHGERCKFRSEDCLRGHDLWKKRLDNPRNLVVEHGKPGCSLNIS